MTQRSIVAALMPAAVFHSANRYFPSLFCFLTFWKTQDNISASESQGATHVTLCDRSESTHRYGRQVGGFDEGTMAKFGRQVSGDEEFGWIRLQAKDTMSLSWIIWLMVVVGGWFRRTR